MVPKALLRNDVATFVAKYDGREKSISPGPTKLETLRSKLQKMFGLPPSFALIHDGVELTKDTLDRLKTTAGKHELTIKYNDWDNDEETERQDNEEFVASVWNDDEDALESQNEGTEDASESQNEGNEDVLELQDYEHDSVPLGEDNKDVLESQDYEHDLVPLGEDNEDVLESQDYQRDLDSFLESNPELARYKAFMNPDFAASQGLTGDQRFVIFQNAQYGSEFEAKRAVTMYKNKVYLNEQGLGHFDLRFANGETPPELLVQVTRVPVDPKVAQEREEQRAMRQAEQALQGEKRRATLRQRPAATPVSEAQPDFDLLTNDEMADLLTDSLVLPLATPPAPGRKRNREEVTPRPLNPGLQAHNARKAAAVSTEEELAFYETLPWKRNLDMVPSVFKFPDTARPITMADLPPRLEEVMRQYMHTKGVDDKGVQMYRHVSRYKGNSDGTTYQVQIHIPPFGLVYLARVVDPELGGLLAAAVQYDTQRLYFRKSLYAWLLWMIETGDSAVDEWLATSDDLPQLLPNDDLGLQDLFADAEGLQAIDPGEWNFATQGRREVLMEVADEHMERGSTTREMVLDLHKKHYATRDEIMNLQIVTVPELEAILQSDF